MGEIAIIDTDFPTFSEIIQFIQTNPRVSLYTKCDKFNQLGDDECTTICYKCKKHNLVMVENINGKFLNYLHEFLGSRTDVQTESYNFSCNLDNHSTDLITVYSIISS